MNITNTTANKAAEGHSYICFVMKLMGQGYPNRFLHGGDTWGETGVRWGGLAHNSGKNLAVSQISKKCV